ncbi:MAG: hypothetical protein ACYTHM_07495 [Planctomycetota bacterium]|jgi:hypothetical protein
MRTLLNLGLIFSFTFLAAQVFAGEEEAKKKKLSWEQRMLLQRMRHQLNLDEEQVEKARTLLLEEKERTRKGILELLTEEQKEAFKAMEKSGRGGPHIQFGDGQGGGFRSFSFPTMGKRGPYGMTVKELKKEIGITEEEASAVEKVFKRYNEKKKEAMEKMVADFDFGNLGKIFGGNQELDEKAVKKVREALAEERREAFDAFVEKKKKRRSGFTTRAFGPDGELDFGDIGKSIKEGLKGIKGLGGEVKKALEGDAGLPSLDEICKEAGFEGIEGEILREKVKGILEKEKVFRKFLADSRKTLKAKTANEEEAKTRLDAFRKERHKQRASLTTLKDELRELLTFEQEAKLVAMGVLE